MTPNQQTKKARTAIYSRISTDRQSHDSQLSELREHCQRRGWIHTVEYQDQVSGSVFTRTGLDELMAAARRGRIDVVVCYKLDRLGRSLPHLAQLIAELTNHGVALVCPSQGIDTSTANPASQLQLNILMAVAEFEREIIRERVRAGLKAAKARGVKLGRPATLKARFADVSKLVDQGMGARAIARRLGMPVSSAAKVVRRVKELRS